MGSIGKENRHILNFNILIFNRMLVIFLAVCWIVSLMHVFRMHVFAAGKSTVITLNHSTYTSVSYTHLRAHETD